MRGSAAGKEGGACRRGFAAAGPARRELPAGEAGSTPAREKGPKRRASASDRRAAPSRSFPGVLAKPGKAERKHCACPVQGDSCPLGGKCVKRTRVNTYTTCPVHKHVIHNRLVLGWQGRVSKTKIASHLLSYAACAVEGLTRRFPEKAPRGRHAARGGAGRGGLGAFPGRARGVPRARTWTASPRTSVLSSQTRGPTGIFS